MVSIVVACLFVVSGLWGVYFGLSESAGDDAMATTILSGLMLFAGAGFLIRESGLLGRLLPTPADDDPAPVADAMANESAETVDPEEQGARFSVIGDGDDEGALDRVRSFLENDPRVESVSSDAGRWYSVPDRDDLPEWTALRVSSREKDRDALMEMTHTFMAEKIGVSLTVDYF